MATIDASVILACLFAEAGADRALARAMDGRISTVSVTEVMTKCLDRGVAGHDALALIASMNIAIVDFDQRQAIVAAEIRARTRKAGLSLGDRACIALAIESGTTALTADRVWADLDLPCQIEVIR